MSEPIVLSPFDVAIQRHEIARMAAGRLATVVPFDRRPTPASAGKAVVDAYLAAQKQLAGKSD